MRATCPMISTPSIYVLVHFTTWSLLRLYNAKCQYYCIGFGTKWSWPTSRCCPRIFLKGHENPQREEPKFEPSTFWIRVFSVTPKLTCSVPYIVWQGLQVMKLHITQFSPPASAACSQTGSVGVHPFTRGTKFHTHTNYVTNMIIRF
jgi:hypothetical protein